MDLSKINGLHGRCSIQATHHALKDRRERLNIAGQMRDVD